MPTARPFARYTGSGTPSGTERYGDLLVGIDMSNPYNSNYSGVKWWNGADEDLGYIIATTVATEDQPTPVDGDVGSVGFFSTTTFNNSEFVGLVKIITGYNPSSATDAKNYLLSNGYWTSWTETGDLVMFISGTSISGSNLIDLSGFSNDSDLYGGYSEKFYNDYKIIELNGTNGYIQSPSFGTDLDTNFTFEVWVNSTTSNGTIIGEWSGPAPTGWTDAQMAFVSGYINAGVFNGGYVQGPTFSTNTWYNIVTVYNNTSQLLNLYVNGVLSASQSLVKQNPGDTWLTLGREDGANFYLGGATGYLNGRVAMWKVYNYDLTSQQITNNYNTYKTIWDDSLVFNVDASYADSYPGSGTTWYDISYKGNDATVTNATYSIFNSVDTFGFDGNGDYVSIGQPIPTGSSYSISAWVYANSVTGARNIVSSQDSPFWIAGGTLYAGVGGNYTEVSSGSFPLNTWKHVAMTFNTTSNTMTLYVDGIQVNQNTNVTANYTAQNTFIGSHFSGGVNVSFWNGYIAQVKIYNSEQTSSQILNHFELTRSTYGV